MDTIRILEDMESQQAGIMEKAALADAILAAAQPELAQNLHNACTDLISRQAALDECDEWIDTFDGDGDTDIRRALRLFKGGLKRLPSAQPEPCEDAVSRNAIIQNLRER